MTCTNTGKRLEKKAYAPRKKSICVMRHDDRDGHDVDDDMHVAVDDDDDDDQYNVHAHDDDDKQ